MPFWLQNLVDNRVMQANDGEGGDLPPPADTPATFTQADIEKMLEEKVSGLKAKNNELIGKLKATSGELNEVKSKYDGIDPEVVHNIVKRFSDDEEAKLITEGKIDEVLEKRTERMKSAHQKETEKLQQELAKAQERASKFTDRVLGDTVRQAGTEAGIHKSAFEDAIYRAKGLFDIADDGEVVAKEGVFGKDGKPLTIKEWFSDMQEQAPHWFPAPQGGGLGQNKGGIPSNLKRGNMTASQKAEFIEKHGQQAFLALPK